MIRSSLNLRCKAGHWHYAPPRELAEWIGHSCGYVHDGDGRKKCLEDLYRLRPLSAQHKPDNERAEASAR